MEYNLKRKFLREAKFQEERRYSVGAQDVWDGVWEPQCVRDVARHAYYNNCATVGWNKTMIWLCEIIA